jgi:hypothetical protein
VYTHLQKLEITVLSFETTKPGVFYPFIFGVLYLTKEQHQILYKSGKSATEMMEKKARVVHGCLNGMSKLSKTEKGERGDARSQAHAHQFL